MVEITDDLVKKKHKEFDDRVMKILTELRGGGPRSPALEKLRQLAIKTKLMKKV